MPDFYTHATQTQIKFLPIHVFSWEGKKKKRKYSLHFQRNEKEQTISGATLGMGFLCLAGFTEEIISAVFSPV